MNYTLHQLRIFQKIVETQSITKTADELFLTQPAVSIQLKNFQDQFEMPLTEIIGRKIYITEFGREIAEAVNAILLQIETINHKTLAYKNYLFGKLKISVVSTGKYVMPYFLSDFLQLHPGVELEMDVTNKNKVIKSLQNNEVDFALVSIIPEKLKIEKIDLMPNKLYLIGKKKAENTDSIDSMSFFKENHLLFRENGSGTRQIMEQYILKNKIQVTKKIELTSNEAVKQSILAGLGYSIMPLIGIRKEIQDNELEIIPIKGLPIKTNWSLIWLKDKKLSPSSIEFLNYLKTEKNNIIKNTFKWYESI